MDKSTKLCKRPFEILITLLFSVALSKKRVARKNRNTIKKLLVLWSNFMTKIKNNRRKLDFKSNTSSGGSYTLKVPEKSLRPWTVSIDLPFCIFLLKLAWQYTYFEIEKNDSENLRDTLNRIHWFTVLHFSVKISVIIYFFRNWKSACLKLHARPWTVSIGFAIVSQHEKQELAKVGGFFHCDVLRRAIFKKSRILHKKKC